MNKSTDLRMKLHHQEIRTKTKTKVKNARYTLQFKCFVVLYVSSSQTPVAILFHPLPGIERGRKLLKHNLDFVKELVQIPEARAD